MVDNGEDDLLGIISPEEAIDAIIQNEDIILDRKDQLKKSFELAINNYRPHSATENIERLLSIALAGTDTEDDEAEEELANAVVGLLQVLMSMQGEPIEYLKKQNASEDLTTFVINCMLEYGDELQRMNFYQTQGENWWSHLRTDRIISEANIKHHHKITVDRTDEVEIDSSPHSDWIIIHHLMNEVVAAYQEIVNGDEVINTNSFNNIRRLMYYIESEIESNEYDIDLPSKRELLEDIVENDEKP